MFLLAIIIIIILITIIMIMTIIIIIFACDSNRLRVRWFGAAWQLLGNMEGY